MTATDAARTPLGLVASGHPATTAAGVEILRAGGNAFDAAVGAGLAAALAEPCLTSLAGGGFLMARTAGGDEVLFDFFVAAPGLGRTGGDPGPLVCVPVDFGHAVQDFHVGAASVAVPGVLAGYLHVHERLGRLELDRVAAPAVRLAAGGVTVEPSVARVVDILVPILERTPTGRRLFFRDGRPLAAGDEFRAPELADFLTEVGAGRVSGFGVDQLGGGVTAQDLDRYRVEERAPLRLRYRDAEVALNPPPSFGGTLVAHALALLGRQPAGGPEDPDQVVHLAEALVALAEHRSTLGPAASRGTTHLSVTDAEGNVASMTTSNGSGSGEFAEGTGVQLNNVMGEEDLHPGGFGSAEPGTRIGSMMTPTLVELADGRVAAFGSGGSERIRSTITQLVVDLVDHGMGLAEAVGSPRLHWDGTRLQAEPGRPTEVLDALRRRWPLNEWSVRDLYFGGAHGVEPPAEAVGDPRRGGVGAVVQR